MEIKIETIDNGFIIDVTGAGPNMSDPMAQRPAARAARFHANCPEEMLGKLAEIVLDRYGRTK